MSAAAFGVAAAVTGAPRVAAVLVGLLTAGPVYPLLLSTAPGTTDPRVLASFIAVGAFSGSVVTLAGTVAFYTAGLAGVLLLAAAMLGVSLLASGVARRGAPDSPHP